MTQLGHSTEKGGNQPPNRGWTNAYDSARGVEARSLTTLLPFLRERAYDGRLVFTSGGTLSRFLQQTVRDVLINLGDRAVWSIELKAELEKTGNFLFETWSNRNLESRASHALRGSARVARQADGRSPVLFLSLRRGG